MRLQAQPVAAKHGTPLHRQRPQRRAPVTTTAAVVLLKHGGGGGMQRDGGGGGSDRGAVQQLSADVRKVP